MEETFQELHQNQLDTSDTDGWSSSGDEVPEKRRRLSLPTKHPKKSPAPVMYDTYSITTFIVMWLVNNNKLQLFWVSFFVTATLKDLLGKDLNDVLKHQNLQMFLSQTLVNYFHFYILKMEKLREYIQNDRIMYVAMVLHCMCLKRVLLSQVVLRWTKPVLSAFACAVL